MDPAGAGAEFRIPTVGRQHGGSYSCSYRPRSEPFVSSQPSDPVQLVVAEPSYPKPNISLSPSGGVSLGGAVTVRCRGQRRGMRFVLNKEGRHFPPVDPVRFRALFPISNVRREDGGSYSCSYHSRSEPFAVSYPSDPVVLVVRDPSLPRPSISLSPTWVTAPGADVTIRCQGQCQDTRFFLHKAGDLNPQRHMDPAGDGAEFHIPTVGRQHGGNYSCSYRPRSEPFVSSQPSDPMQLVVAGREFFKPTVWVSPSRVVALRGSVTIGCGGWYRSMKFFLRKAGHPNPQVQTVVPDWTMAEFRIPSVGREAGGSYTCDYHSITEQNRSSHPSDPVEIIVAGCVSHQQRAPGARRELQLLLSQQVGAVRRVVPQRLRGAGGERSQLTQTLHLSEHRFGHRLRGKHHHPVSGAAPGREVLPAQGRRPEPAATHGRCWGRCQVPHPHRGPAAQRELQLQLPAPIAALHLIIHQQLCAAAPPEHPDFTRANIARLGLGAAVLLVLGLILAEAYYSRPRRAP
ncbi:immunoglobulin superfamily member 1-like [Macrochelys suwanniensis]